MNKYIFFDLIKKNYKEFENGRMSNEFFEVLASLSVIIQNQPDIHQLLGVSVTHHHGIISIQ